MSRMLSPKDIDNLAALARLEIPAEEKETLRKEVDSILGYVGEIQKLTTEKPAEISHGEIFAGKIKKEAGSSTKTWQSQVSVGEIRNVFREDKNPHLSGEFTEDLLAEAPQRQGEFVKVKKIL